MSPGQRRNTMKMLQNTKSGHLFTATPELMKFANKPESNLVEVEVTEQDAQLTQTPIDFGDSFKNQHEKTPSKRGNS